MPFWSRKVKEKARDEGDDNERVSSISTSSIRVISSTPMHNVDDITGGSSSKAKQDAEVNLIRERLTQRWVTETERLRDVAFKVQEAEGKCSNAHLAAQEAAIEALNMCVEMGSRTHKSGTALSYITEEQDSNMLRVFQERDELIVPIKITRLSIEDVVSIHSGCCCEHVKRSEITIERSFRGERPIREDTTVHNTSKKHTTINESKGGRDGEKPPYLLEDGPPPPGALGEPNEGLPSYKEATG